MERGMKSVAQPRGEGRNRAILTGFGKNYMIPEVKAAFGFEGNLLIFKDLRGF